jgi:8-oxo-dGTP pyrophosphatase MutT (NUDIX family)
VLCVNDAGKVLLWRWPERGTGGFGWLPVGGGIEPGEEPVEAARREWAEETGLPPESVTEHHVFVRRNMWWEGARHLNDEAFFLARAQGEPRPEASTRGFGDRNRTSADWPFLRDHHLNQRSGANRGGTPDSGGWRSPRRHEERQHPLATGPVALWAFPVSAGCGTRPGSSSGP